MKEWIQIGRGIERMALANKQCYYKKAWQKVQWQRFFSLKVMTRMNMGVWRLLPWLVLRASSFTVSLIFAQLLRKKEGWSRELMSRISLLPSHGLLLPQLEARTNVLLLSRTVITHVFSSKC